LGVSVINKSIKFFTIFLLAFNVFAGGDDRDEEYYEALDQELATFEAQLDAELAAAEMMAEIEEELLYKLPLKPFRTNLLKNKQPLLPQLLLINKDY